MHGLLTKLRQQLLFTFYLDKLIQAVSKKCANSSTIKGTLFLMGWGKGYLLTTLRHGNFRP